MNLRSSYWVFCLLLLTPVLSNAQDSLIQSGDVWSFLDNGKAPGNGWTELYFPEPDWGKGPSSLGYDSRSGFDVVTCLEYGGNLTAKHPVYFLRKSFLIPGDIAYTAFKLNFRQDDGLVIHINNVEVVRSNLPDGPITYKTYAQKMITGSLESEVSTIYLEPTYFKAGANILAVSLHQSNPSSSDVFFDLELIGIRDISMFHKFRKNQNQNERTLLENDKLSLLDKTYELNVEKTKREFQSKLITTQWVVLLGIIGLGGLIGFMFYRFYLQQLEDRKKAQSEEEQLNKKIKYQENEIISNSITTIRNKNFLKELKFDLVEISIHQPKVKSELSKLVNKIEVQSDADGEWDKLKIHFDSVYSGFFEKLSLRCPELSQQELRHCGFIKVQLDTKEISQIFRIDPKSVQAARYRIKKKLHLSEKEDLREFIVKF